MKESTFARAKTLAEKLPDDNKLKEFAEKAGDAAEKAKDMME